VVSEIIPAESTLAPASTGLVRVALIGALGGLLFGYDTAVINGATQYLALDFHLSSGQEGLAVGAALLGCIPGALMAGRLADRFGRRPTLFACALLFLVSGIASAIVASFPEFVIARLIAGVSIGLCSMICPVFISEFAPPDTRGRLGTLFQLGIVTGIFLTLFINALIQGQGDAAWNTAIGWRWMLGSEALPALILIGLLRGAKESPRWHGNRAHSRPSGAPWRSVFVSSLRSLTKTGESPRWRMALANPAAHQPLFRRAHARALTIAIVIALVSQFCGINAIMYYSTRIFARSGLGIANAFWATMLVGLVNLIFTLVATAFVDRLGRRSLLIAGLAIQTVSLALVGFLFLHPGSDLLLLTAILVFIAAFAMALGPISWLLPSEIFMDSVRGRAMALSAFSVWVGAFVVAQTFPLLNDSPAFGPAPTFFLYAAVSFFGLIFTLAVVPETRRLSLEAASEIARGR
jgi:SP family arabinose:H+ symporter-like MFS transporter